MPDWFNNLPVFLRILLALSAMPLAAFVVGVAIFVMEPPGNSPYGGKKPTLLRALGSTMMAGTIGIVLLSAIFSLSSGLGFLLRRLGLAGEWISAASFFLSLMTVLGAVAYYFEFRHYKK